MLITEMIIGHVQRINDAFGRNELGNEQKLHPMSTEASMSYATAVVTVVAVTFDLSSQLDAQGLAKQRNLSLTVAKTITEEPSATRCCGPCKAT